MKISMNISTILPGNLLAPSLVNSSTLVLRSVLGSLSWDLVTFLLRTVSSHRSVLGSAVMPVLSVTLLAGKSITFLPGNLPTVLPWDLVANLLGGVVSVGNRLRSAILSGNLLAVMLRNLLTLLPWFIPTLLLAIDIRAFLFSYSLAFLLILGIAFLFVLGIAILVISVFGHWFLFIMALLLIFSVTLLFILSTALLLILRKAFLLRNTGASLLWNRLNTRNLDHMTLFVIISRCKRLLDSSTPLTGFVRTLFLPNNLAFRKASQGNAHESKQQSY